MWSGKFERRREGALCYDCCCRDWCLFLFCYQVDHRCFVVAEEGEVGTSRVLLHDAPGDAVALFLKYLYTAEYFIPQHLLSDVIDLAIRLVC